MKLAVISPTSWLDCLNASRDFHLVLTHRVLQDPTYAGFYKNVGGYKVLDNSLMENDHHPFALKDVLRAAEIIGADEIVLPDAFRQGQETYELAERSFDTICAHHASLLEKYKFAIVVQGNTPYEWWECYENLVGVDWPGEVVLHIPKVMDAIWPMGRLGLLRHLSIPGNLSHYQYHLLGIWTNPIELLYASQFPFVRSCDTALPVQAGYQGIMFHPRFGFDSHTAKPTRPKNYFDLEFPSDFEIAKTVSYNVAVLDNFARGLEGPSRAGFDHFFQQVQTWSRDFFGRVIPATEVSSLAFEYTAATTAPF